MEDLSDVIPQCYKIGKMLGLQSSILEEIKKQSFDAPSAMIMIIKHWLMHGHRELITWKSLVEAVAHKNGGNNVPLAMKLTKKHKGKGLFKCTGAVAKIIPQMNFHKPQMNWSSIKSQGTRVSE